MAHKTISISEQAYGALAREKRGNESFTETILRITSEQGKASTLLRVIEELPKDEELARNVESAMKRMRRARIRRVTL
jgi:predicted CopG family antitoxin